MRRHLAEGFCLEIHLWIVLSLLVLAADDRGARTQTAWDETFTQLLVQRHVIIYNTPSYSNSTYLVSLERKKEQQAVSSSGYLIFMEMLFVLVPLLSGLHSFPSSKGHSCSKAALPSFAVTPQHPSSVTGTEHKQPAKRGKEEALSTP